MLMTVKLFVLTLDVPTFDCFYYVYQSIKSQFQ